ncbi:MAG: hypothetical protein DMG72_09955 [Acidobacteria bacterium]|nr:MAG: hypothetical protein DMG72_09955 [Acidobacteriota bacterium]
MKKILVFVVVFLLGFISGVLFHHWTGGATDRARISALETELKARNEKLDKCTDALIQGLHANTPWALAASPESA